MMGQAISGDELDRVFGARAKLFRLKRGLSIGDVAARSGWSVDDVLALEEGRRTIKALTMFKLSRIYDVGCHRFYAGLVSDQGERIDNAMVVRLLKNTERSGPTGV